MRRWDLFRRGLIRTARYSIDQVEVGHVEDFYLDLLYDPQTSGGLLMSVSPKEYENMMRDFHRHRWIQPFPLSEQLHQRVIS